LSWSERKLSDGLTWQTGKLPKIISWGNIPASLARLPKKEEKNMLISECVHFAILKRKGVIDFD
jgi:hypothetical protein